MDKNQQNNSEGICVAIRMRPLNDRELAGTSKRTVEATQMNNTSIRSHTIFKKVKQYIQDLRHEVDGLRQHRKGNETTEPMLALLAQKDEEIEALSAERDRAVQQLKLEMGAHADLEDKLRRRIEALGQQLKQQERNSEEKLHLAQESAELLKQEQKILMESIELQLSHQQKQAESMQSVLSQQLEAAVVEHQRQQVSMQQQLELQQGQFAQQMEEHKKIVDCLEQQIKQYTTQLQQEQQEDYNNIMELVELKRLYDGVKGAAVAGEGSRGTTESKSQHLAEVADLQRQLVECRGLLEAARGVLINLKNKLKQCSKQLQEYENERAAVIEVLNRNGVDTTGLTDESLAGDDDSNSIDEQDLADAVSKLAELLVSARTTIEQVSHRQQTSQALTQTAKIRNVEEELRRVRREMDELSVQKIALEKRVKSMKTAYGEKSVSSESSVLVKKPAQIKKANQLHGDRLTCQLKGSECARRPKRWLI